MITTGSLLDRVARCVRDERRSKVWYPMQFLYRGFDQQANIRCFRFQGVLPKERPCNASKFIDLKLNADMSLWRAIQDFHPGRSWTRCSEVIGPEFGAPIAAS